MGFDRKSVYRVEGGVVRRVDESLKLAPAKDEEGGMAFYADADWLGLEGAERFAQAMADYYAEYPTLRNAASLSIRTWPLQSTMTTPSDKLRSMVLNNCCWLVMSSSAAFNSAAVWYNSSCSGGKSFKLGDSNSWVRNRASCALPNCSPTALSCISTARGNHPFTTHLDYPI